MIAGLGVAAFEPQSWEARATCVTASWVDPDWFFPEGKGGHSTAAVQRARNVCADCPVVRQCLELALSVPPDADHGIFGGTTPRERRYLRHETTAA